ncbi:uncharacterized protein LOC115898326 [Rhinopithecus roxellana]|uniref:uncharacterized protein LOC115898326 n=1 Tax=Rhinopithecus roxellana TaxID=61622 RepID=UPI0012378DF1|nr:uncharacterized protein LOC115898326 [Rhinopithecus roxellana]XP_030788841.1 uncharacterized protein LOC115898326 [Rhinopithecus roxellana]
MSPGPGWNVPYREDRPHLCSLLCFPVAFPPPARALGPSHNVSPSQNPAYPRRLVHDIQAGPFFPCSPAAGTVPYIQQALSKCLANIGLLHLQEVLRPSEWPGSRSPASASPALCSAPARGLLVPASHSAWASAAPRARGLRCCPQLPRPQLLLPIPAASKPTGFQEGPAARWQIPRLLFLMPELMSAMWKGHFSFPTMKVARSVAVSGRAGRRAVAGSRCRGRDGSAFRRRHWRQHPPLPSSGWWRSLYCRGTRGSSPFWISSSNMSCWRHVASFPPMVLEAQCLPPPCSRLGPQLPPGSSAPDSSL